MFPSFTEITPQEDKLNFKLGYNRIAQDIAFYIMENKSCLIIDVRTKEEYAQGFIENAINIPVETMFNGMILKDIPYDLPILVYCRSGVRSKNAGLILANSGYKQVLDFGGILTWKYGIVNKG